MTENDPNPNATLVRPEAEQARLAASVGFIAVPGYEIESTLGRGGMGVVYKAKQIGLNRVVALKMLIAGQYADPGTRARFLLEAESVAALEHPHIIRVFAFGESGGHPYLAMEFVPGGTLAERIKANGPLPANEATELLAKLAGAVAHAHSRGVVHRDIKPLNVLLTAEGEPRLTDFGLAKVGRADQNLSVTGEVLGTAAYMPPEQAAGKVREVGTVSDVYALGAVLYDLLTGRPPFTGDSAAVTLQKVLTEEPDRPRKLNPSIPRDLETICLKCLEKESAKRYPTAQALADDLLRYARNEPISVRPAGAMERGYKWVKRNKGVSGLTSITVLSLIIGISVSAVYASNYYHSAEDLQRALRQEETTATGLRESLMLAQRREGLLAVEKGSTLCERGEERIGLLWFARGSALLHDTGADERDMWYVRMNLSLWGQKLSPSHGTILHPVEDCGAYLPDRKSFLARIPGGTWARLKTNGGRLQTYSRPPLTPDAAKIASRPELTEQGFAGRSFALAENGTVFGATFNWSVKDFKKQPRGPALSVMVVWDVETGKLVSSVERLAGDTGWTVPLSPLWSPNLRYALTLDESNAGGQLWDVHRGRIIAAVHQRRDDEAGAFLMAAFSSDERRVLTASPKRIVVWDCATGTRLSEFACDKPPLSDCILFSPDGEEVICGASLNQFATAEIYRWNARSGQRIEANRECPFVPRRLRFTPDGKQLIAENPPVEVLRFFSQGGRDLDNKEWMFSAWEWPSGRPWAHPEIHPQWVSPDKQFAIGKKGEWVEWPTTRPLGRRTKGELPVGFSAIGDIVLTHGDSYRCREAQSARLIGPRYEGSLARSGGRVLTSAFDVVEPLDTASNEIVFSSAPPFGKKSEIEVTIVRLAPIVGSPEQVTLWAQLIAEMELDESGNVRTLSPDELADRKRRLTEHGGDPLPK